MVKGRATDVGGATTLPGPASVSAPSLLSTMTPPAALSGSAPIDRTLHVDRQEHASEVVRTRRILPLAALLWLTQLPIDWLVSTFIVPGSLWDYAIVRVAGVIPLLLAWLWIRRDPMPGPGVLHAIDLLNTSVFALCTSLMCLLAGGIDSLYAAYIALVLAGRGTLFPSQWQRGVLLLGVPALVHPVTLVVAGLVDAGIAEQFADPRALAGFVYWQMFIGGAATLLIIAGHSLWAIRRQLFESRDIGQYRLRKRLGGGGMGDVWVAHHHALRRDVALKILRPEFGTDPVAVARFEREVLATTELAHPNTVRIYDYGVTDDGLWYYAMERLEGTDLDGLVKQHGGLPLDRALHIVTRIARALAEAHARGIVHRDIKPQNIFVTKLLGEPDFPKLLDFGIAKVVDRSAGDLTQTGWIGGTPTYISPEVAAGGDATARSDVYSLGATLYFTITGTPPFIADNVAALLAAHMGEPLESVSSRSGRPLPPELEAMIARCLEKTPERRFADAGELAKALDGMARPASS